MTDKLRDPLLAVMNLPTHRETLFGMAEGPALYEGQRLYLKRSEVLAELAAALAAAPQPAPDREELVRLLQIITRNGSLDDGRTLHEVIADALLARGLRLPGGGETMAWAVVRKGASLDIHTLFDERPDPKTWRLPKDAEVVRVAIRVVEGGDDAA